MKSKSIFTRKVGVVTLLLFLTATAGLFAAEPVPGVLTVRDSLTSPNQPATIEATFTQKGLPTGIGLGGEPIELLIAGNVVATATTGGDGRAVLSYTPKAKGALPFIVRVGTTSSLAGVEAGANLIVWEHRGPMMAVEMTALMEDAVSRRPMPDAADELEKLTRFYYNVLYVVTQDTSVATYDQVNEQARQWLKEQKFPVGYILVLPEGPEGFGAKLDELHAAGWTTLKVGVGRTKVFAEAFLQRRLDAVLVADLGKGKAPRKAKVVKEWKDVRKKM
ncbi:MAG: hypothetical protein Q8L74_06330 [Nitrospirota bacterium]|nr:hypothetical protein [Nitrospirota bacterium]MDP2384454.1 hypothetical protein [Nitrospirota bacterium]MDP3598186.1 hypothetical protein [Nitrospirota bacterium]